MTEVAGLEAEPAVAADLFGDRLPVVRRFTHDLADQGVRLGLIGPAEPARLWTRHIVNCGLLAGIPRPDARVADVGSGAGLPGLVLAAARADLRLTLIEPMERRAQWLRDEAGRLDLDVDVVRARAEEAPDRHVFDVVTARAVGPLSRILRIVAPLARPGGELVLMKGSSVDQELSAAAKIVRSLGLEDPRVEIVGTGMATEVTRIFRATVPPVRVTRSGDGFRGGSL